MLRQFTSFLIAVLFANGCAKRTSDFYIDTVHGYLRCNTGLRDVSRAMIEICHEYDIKQLHSKYQEIEHEDDHKVLYGYDTTSYMIPGDKELILDTVAEKGQPLHIKFEMEPGALYSREEIMIELARRIDVLPKANPLKVKTPLEDSDITPEKNL